MGGSIPRRRGPGAHRGTVVVRIQGTGLCRTRACAQPEWGTEDAKQRYHVVAGNAFLATRHIWREEGIFLTLGKHGELTVVNEISRAHMYGVSDGGVVP